MADIGGLSIDLSQLQGNVANVGPKVKKAIRAAFMFHSTRAVAYARQNAPWTDRTTNARNGLYARVVNTGTAYQLVIGHGVPYGIWLETRWSGRYAIIRPTVDWVGPRLMATARTLVAHELANG